MPVFFVVQILWKMADILLKTMDDLGFSATCVTAIVIGCSLLLFAFSERCTEEESTKDYMFFFLFSKS